MDQTIFSGMLIFSFSIALTGCNSSAGDGEYQPYEKLVAKNELANPSPKNQQSKSVPENRSKKKTEYKSLVAPTDQKEKAVQNDKAVKNKNTVEKDNLAKNDKPVLAKRKIAKTSEPSFAELLISAAIGHTASAVATEETGNSSSAAIASTPREVKILIPDKDFIVVGPEDAIRVSYDDINLLKVMNLEPVTATAPGGMPGWLKNLDGKRIRIRGFMSPTFTASDLTSFLLGRDNQACCFPGRAKIYDLFRVKMRDGQTVDFIDNRPFDVVGIFHIDPWVEDGELWELYHITDATVIAP